MHAQGSGARVRMAVSPVPGQAFDCREMPHPQHQTQRTIQVRPRVNGVVGALAGEGAGMFTGRAAVR